MNNRKFALRLGMVIGIVLGSSGLSSATAYGQDAWELPEIQAGSEINAVPEEDGSFFDEGNGAETIFSEEEPELWTQREGAPSALIPDSPEGESFSLEAPVEPEEAESSQETLTAAAGVPLSYFPDPVFRELLSEYDWSGAIEVDEFGFERDAPDGILSADEQQAVDLIYLDISGCNVKDCTGIEYLKWLKEFYCSDTDITSLDLSGCTALTALSCSNTPLSTLNLSGCTSLSYLYCSNTELKNLDLSGLASLSYLYCSNTELKNLDLSGLASLSVLHCSNTELKNLDLSGLASLSDLDCSNSELKNLDLSGLASLSYLYCSNTELKSLDLSGLASLSVLECDSTELKELDLSGCVSLPDFSLPKSVTDLNAKNCTSLTSLYFGRSNLKNLDMSGCTALTYLYCNDTPLSTLNLSGCTSLYFLDCSNTELKNLDLSGLTSFSHLNCSNTELKNLDLSGCDSLLDFSVPESVTDLNAKNCTSLEVLRFDSGNLVNLDLSGCTALISCDCENAPLSTLNLNGCASLVSLSLPDSVTDLSAENCTSLENIYYEDKDLVSLDLSGCTALTRLDCDDNRLSKLDIKGCSSLTDLDCERNNLTSLDLTGCNSLTTLFCRNNSLTSLELTGYSSLTILYCSYNSLTSLSLTGCSSLTELQCENNSLTSLSLTGCSSLTTLYCTNNSLTSLNLKDCSHLEYLFCNNNNLTDLDVKNCPALTRLLCYDNHLTTLSLAGHTLLTYLDCSYNNIKNLNLTGCSSLTELWCTRNKLTSLNLKNYSSITYLECSSNKLTSLNLKGCTSLTKLVCGDNSLTTLDIRDCKALVYLDWFGNPLGSLDLDHNPVLSDLPGNGSEITAKAYPYNGSLAIDLSPFVSDVNRISYVSVGKINRSKKIWILPVGTTQAEYYYDTHNEKSPTLFVTVTITSPLRDISSCTVTLKNKKEFTYTGKAIKPAVIVKDGSKTLKKSVDYKVSYKNNKEVGTAIIIITGCGNYRGTLKHNFKIVKAENEIIASDQSIVYSPKEQTVKLEVDQTGDAELLFSSDSKAIVVDKKGNVTVRAKYIGKAKITITAKGNKHYRSTKKTITFTVNPTPTTLTEVKKSAGIVIYASWKKNSSGNGYELQYSTDSSFKTNAKLINMPGRLNKKTYINNLVNGGTYHVRVRVYYKNSNNDIFYSAWSPAKSVKVAVADVAPKDNPLTVSDITCVYSDKDQTIPINVRQAGNAKLLYSSNNKMITVNSKGEITIEAKYIGEAEITITARANTHYKRSVKKITVTVNPCPTEFKTVKKTAGMVIAARWKVARGGNGYELQWSTNKNFKKNVKSCTLGGRLNRSKDITGLKNGKTYYVRVRAYKKSSTGKTYYSEWSSVKSVKIAYYPS